MFVALVALVPWARLTAQEPPQASSPSAPPAAADEALNKRAMDALELIRRAYPIEFSEAYAIHQAIRTHLQAGGDPADVRRLVKRAVIDGCRDECMDAVFQGFTRLNQAGLPPPEVESLLTDAIRDGRRAMPPRYTYQMLAATITERVDRRLGGPAAPH